MQQCEHRMPVLVLAVGCLGFEIMSPRRGARVRHVGGAAVGCAVGRALWQGEQQMPR